MSIFGKLNQVQEIKDQIKERLILKGYTEAEVGDVFETYPELIRNMTLNDMNRHPQWVRDSIVCYYDVLKQGVTNERMKKLNRPFLFDLSGNGNDLELINFKWDGESGMTLDEVPFKFTSTEKIYNIVEIEWDGSPVPIIPKEGTTDVWEDTLTTLGDLKFKSSKDGSYLLHKMAFLPDPKDYTVENGTSSEPPLSKLKIKANIAVAEGNAINITYSSDPSRNVISIPVSSGTHYRFKAEIKGIPYEGKMFFGIPSKHIMDIDRDGTYYIDFMQNSTGIKEFGIGVSDIGQCDISVLLEPIDKVLSFNGKDNYGKCVRMPILDNFTLIARRRISSKLGYNSQYCFADKGAFLCEFSSNQDSNTHFKSFGKDLVINSDIDKDFVVFTKGKYMDTFNGSGNDPDTDTLFLFNDKSLRNPMRGDLINLFIFNRSLTDDEIRYVRENMAEDHELIIKDPEAKNICASNFGVRGYVTERDLNKVTYTGKCFQKSSITEFPEFKHFKNISLDDSTNTFEGSNKLVSICLPDNIKYLRASMFKNCSKLKDINLENIISYGWNCMEGCSSLKPALSKNIVYLGAFAFYSTLLEEIDLPNLKNYSDKPEDNGMVFDRTFGNCRYLKKIKSLGGSPSLKLWGNNKNTSSTVFFNSPIETLIGNFLDFGQTFSCFLGNTTLSTMVIKNKFPPTLIDIPAQCPIAKGLGRIFVPDESVDRYKTATQWNTYAERIFPISIYENYNKEIFLDDPAEQEFFRSNIGIDGKLTMAAMMSISKINGFIKPDDFTSIKNFEGFKYMTSLKEIPSKWAKGKASWENIVLPEGLEKLSFECFKWNDKLKYIYLPKSIKVIEGRVMEGEPGYGYHMIVGKDQVIDLPNLTSLGLLSFAYNNFKEVKSLGNINEIQLGVFKGNENLSKVVLPETITSIGDSAFYSCINLKDINLPKAIKNIGNGAFKIEKHRVGRVTLKDAVIDLPNLETIGSEAFYFTRIKKITDLGKINTLPASCFYGSLVKEAELPSSVTTMEEGCLNAESMHTLVMNSIEPPTMSSNSLNDSLRIIYVPDESIEKYKTASNWNAWADRIVEVSKKDAFIDFVEPALGEGVVNEPTKKAFLKHLDYNGDGKVSLGEAEVVTGLTDEFMKSMTNAVSLNELKYMKNLRYVRFGGYFPLKYVEEITLPESLEEIGRYSDWTNGSFMDMARLKKVTFLSDKVKTIPPCCFARNVSLEEINIPSNIRIIDEQAFKNCSKLCIDVNFPNLEELDYGAFAGTVVKSFTNLGVITAWYSRWRDRGVPDSLEVINIPETLTSFGSSAFEGLKNLKKLDFHSKVTSFGNYALAFLSIPYIIVRNPVPPTASNGTFYANSIGSIYVPDESVETYKGATGWNTVADKIKPLSTLPPETV